ncbi:MAG: hypothetical protein JXA97_04820 [Anaerolineales bacterium]|nr:hypothetical protein [Anaerolineales bacterium]
MKTGDERIVVVYDREDRETAQRLLESAGRHLGALDAQYGLPAPRKLRLVVLTSWVRFPFQTAPWFIQPWVVLTFPFWGIRTQRIWPIAGGWQQGYPGGISAVGVKPPRLLAQADRSLGEKLYIKIEDPWLKMESILAHELTHACSNHLHLPVWLHEGLAMAAVDHLLGMATVRPETRSGIRADMLTTDRLRSAYQGRDLESLLVLYAGGYWLVRWLEDEHTDVLQDVLARRRSRREVTQSIAAVMGCGADQLWHCAEEIFARYNVPGMV